MFIKQRQVRRSSKFQSRWSRASYKRREYVASIYTTAVVQGFLAAFLIVAGVRSASMMHLKFPDVVWYLKYLLPAMLLFFGVLVVRALVGNVRQGLEIQRTQRADRPTKKD